mgnify:CR=1 FL=1
MLVHRRAFMAPLYLAQAVYNCARAPASAEYDHDRDGEEEIRHCELCGFCDGLNRLPVVSTRQLP